MKIIFVSLLLIGLSSCAVEEVVAESALVVEEETKIEPTIVGDWKLSDFDIGMEIQAGREELFAKTRKEMLTFSTMSYKADGTYSQKDMMDGEIRTQTGTYLVDGNKLTTITTTTSSDGVKTVTNIDKLTDLEATFSLTTGGSTMTMTYIRL